MALSGPFRLRDLLRDKTGYFETSAESGEYVICTSTTRPASPFTGQRIYETNTGYERLWNGSTWVQNANNPIVTSFPSSPIEGDQVLFKETVTTVAGGGTASAATPPQLFVYSNSAWNPVSGQALLATVTCSGTTGFDIDGIFTSRYDNYRVDYSFAGGSVSNFCYVRMRSGGNTIGTGYQWVAPYWVARPTGSGGPYNGIDGGSTTIEFRVGYMTGDGSGTFTLFGPNLPRVTHLIGQGLDSRDSGAVAQHGCGTLDNTTQCNGMYLTGGGGTLEGKVRIYGLS